jgi:hypothetical protein
MVDLMECDKKICNNGVIQEKKMERGDNEISQAMKAFPGWLSNNVPRLNSFKGVDDQGTESMIKKARVSVRARSEATMVSVKLINKLTLYSSMLINLYLLK